jgi:hypothetical protein
VCESDAIPDLSGVLVAEFGLGVQAWLGTGPYDPRRVEEVSWPTQPIEKPHRGFFTSSWDGRTSAWIDWQATKPDRASEKRSVQLLIPDPGTALYVVNSPGDFAALSQAYPQRYENPHCEPCPDWGRLAAGGPFDAIHMTAAAVSDHDLWYAHRWEVESTLWFRPRLTPLDHGR